MLTLAYYDTELITPVKSFVIQVPGRRHNIQHNDIQHSVTKHNVIQHKHKLNVTLSIATLSIINGCAAMLSVLYAECALY